MIGLAAAVRLRRCRWSPQVWRRSSQLLLVIRRPAHPNSGHLKVVVRVLIGTLTISLGVLPRCLNNPANHSQTSSKICTLIVIICSFFILFNYLLSHDISKVTSCTLIFLFSLKEWKFKEMLIIQITFFSSPYGLPQQITAFHFDLFFV